jgi:HlyD family secretion protein
MESVPPILPKAPAAAKISKKNRRIFFFLIAVFALAALAAFAIFRKHDPVIIVQTEKVARRNITEVVVASGKIQPVKEVHISPEVSGEIIALPVKEGQFVKKGDLILKINPDVYIAALNQAKAGYESSIAAKDSATANLEKADADYKRNLELFNTKLLSESDFIGFKVARDVAKAQLESAIDQVDVAKASVDSAQDALDKTTVVSPLDGTITKLNSQLGERVLGTVQNAGTDIMTISDLNEMEARVDIGEMDVVIIKPGQKVRLEVDSFKDRKFNGVVTDIANSSEGLDSGSYGSASYSSSSSSSSSQGATQFQVRIHVTEKEFFRPGMSVTAEIETRSSTNALAVPIACVTTRVVKEKSKFAGDDPPKTNSISSAGNTTNVAKADKKPGELQKPVEVVFVVNGDHVKTVPVKIGISDDNYWEITDGLHEGDEIVSGSYRAISRDLDDGKKIHKGFVGAEVENPQP